MKVCVVCPALQRSLMIHVVNSRLIAAVFLTARLASRPTNYFGIRCFAMASENDVGGALKKAGLAAKDPKKLTPDEWKQVLPAEQYYVMREAGTERAGSGQYVKHKGQGVYLCAACGASLFASDAKFDSGCGWPSFSEALRESAAAGDEGNIVRRADHSHGIERVEVLCKKCGSHLGHVFDDGPKPTGERFCINSISIDFTPKS